MENQFQPSMGGGLKSFIIQCKRVWHLLRKPTGDEYKATAKVAALGIVAIGLLGFVIGNFIVIAF